MRYVEKCMVCGNKSNRVVIDSTFLGNVDEAPFYFLSERRAVAHGRIVRCEKCGFTFTDPQFEPAEYQRIYREATHCALGNDSLWTAEKRRGRRLAGIVKKYRPDGGRLLDFGCGHGGFLAAIEAFDKIGFEVAKTKQQADAGTTIVTGDFLTMVGKAPLLSGSFDVVTAFDVFEHLPNLDMYLQALTDLIRPGGLLIMTLPNVKSLSARLMGGRWGLFLLEHLWYFEPRTLRGLLEMSGYACVDIGSIFYDVPFSHIMNRIAQTFGLPWRFGGHFKGVIPVPAGQMYGIFRKK